MCHVLREVRRSGNRVKPPVGGVPHHKSDGVRSDTAAGGGRTTGQHGSHQHLPGEHRVKNTLGNKAKG